MNPIAVSASEISSSMEMTVHVSGIRLFRFRMMAIQCLLWLVSVIAPFRVRVEMEDE